MKKIYLNCLSLQIAILQLGIGMTGLQAQDYKISFKGSGQSTTFDSVKVLNLTRGTSLTLNNSDVLHLVSTTGIETQFSEEGNLRIYPNPSGETSKIEFYNHKTGQVDVEIFDITGKIVSRNNTQLVQGCHTFEIAGLHTGIYLVNVVTPCGKYTGNLMSTGENSGEFTIRYLGNVLVSSPGRSLKSIQNNLVQMDYTDGERILFKGISGNYSRVLTLIPTKNDTVNFEFISCTDADKNHYTVVTIGTQTWMAENLKTTHYANGRPIPLVSKSNWYELTATSPAYCWYNDDSTSNASTYGALYTWAGAMNMRASSTANPSGIQGVCPAGWHLPSDSEWTTLTDYLEGQDVAGGKLKETGTTHWQSPNTGATNESGFTALPGAYSSIDGTFWDIGIYANFWSTTEGYSNNDGWRRLLNNDYSGVIRSSNPKNLGFSVRCLRD